MIRDIVAEHGFEIVWNVGCRYLHFPPTLIGAYNERQQLIREIQLHKAEFTRIAADSV